MIQSSLTLRHIIDFSYGKTGKIPQGAHLIGQLEAKSIPQLFRF